MGKVKSESEVPRGTKLSSKKAKPAGPAKQSTDDPVGKEVQIVQKPGTSKTQTRRRGKQVAPSGSGGELKTETPSKSKTGRSKLSVKKVTEGKSSSPATKKSSASASASVSSTTKVPHRKPRVSGATKSKAKSPAGSTTSGQSKGTAVGKPKKSTALKVIGKRGWCLAKPSAPAKAKKSKTTVAKPKPKQKRTGTHMWLPANFGTIYEFKVVLVGFQPPIWRQIQVPANFTFGKLHLAIKAAMGWRSCHSHGFEMYDQTRIGTPLPEIAEMNCLDESVELIADRFDVNHEFNNRILYTYDFGDDWTHVITLERTFEATPGDLYPKCINGERACPPEDVGGVDGYERFLEIMADPKHEEYGEMKEWADDCGWGGDPSHFDPSEFDYYSLLYS